LVHLTRAWLRKPDILLLDEPSAAMDQTLENKIIELLQHWLKTNPQTTLVMVTHKPQMLVLVDRLMVMATGQLHLDGPKQAVFDHMNNQASRQRGDQQGVKH
jgi:ATP-binding cassette subfamily C protein LapB